MLDSAELGPFAWTASPGCETDLTIAPIVCWKWERVNQTTSGKHVFRAFLGCCACPPLIVRLDLLLVLSANACAVSDGPGACL